jgi:proline racemase
VRWSKTLQVVDVHCAGEIGRVITGGVLDIPGATMAEKLRHLNEEDDSLRRLLCSEPRSGPAGSFVLLLPATHPDADAGLIVLQPDQAHAMSGSNAMCAVTAILETGMRPMEEPETIVKLDTAAGLVNARAECRDGKVTRVHLDMPKAFVARQDAVIFTEDWGDIQYNICFGGVFYALVDVSQVGLRIIPEQARQLADTGVELWRQISGQVEITHPEVEAIRNVAYVMFHETAPDGVIRTCTTLRPGRVDRSPCGTGSNSNMALQYAKGAAEIGDMRLSRSIIGGEFSTRLVAATKVGPFDAVQCQISGTCWIYGISQIGLDPSDPFPTGFTLSDTWGGGQFTKLLNKQT